MGRALISVYDKTGVVDLARGLVEEGWDLVSSGGTARAIADAGVPVVDVAELTGYPAILGHRVVTLHPKVHGGLLADRDDPTHRAEMAEHDIPAIDLVVSNLYPFDPTADVATFEHGSSGVFELIDIGGPAMVRAAAKNHAHVGVVVDPEDYGVVLDEIRADGALGAVARLRLARDAFAHTAAYDAAVVQWLDGELEASADAGSGGTQSDDTQFDDPGSGDVEAAERRLPSVLRVQARRDEILRYGENPHQVGARYTFEGERSWWDDAVRHNGKAMSYLNVYDTEAAWQLVHALGDDPAVAVIKHANPCGAARAADLVTAHARAHDCDPDSAFGGIVAVNGPLPVELAEQLAPIFTEVVIAPAYEPGAIEVLSKKTNLRVIEAPSPTEDELHLRSIQGGLLVQTADVVGFDRDRCEVMTDRAPTDQEWQDLDFAWRVAAKVSSNTIVLVKDGQAVGIGAGQQKRSDAGRIAAEKAAGRAVGGACASDAFFPFRDGLDAAADAGATAVVQPGGSIRDDEVIAAANEAGMAMVFTGTRHFRH